MIATALALGSAGPPAAQTASRGVEALAWMEGAWAGEKDGVVMEEFWTGPRGGALLGLWDFLFYASFGFVVTSSVSIALIVGFATYQYGDAARPAAAS